VRRGHHLLLALPLAVVAAALIWIGDMHLTHRDWVAGIPIFGLGLVATFFTVRELRSAGWLR